MKKISFAIILTAILAVFAPSCTYRLYAPDENYPENTAYQPMAQNENHVWVIDKELDSDLGLPTPGAPMGYVYDRVKHKLIINMGVVQAGVEFKSCKVSIDKNQSLVNQLIATEVLPLGTLDLPAAAYSMPDSITLSGEQAENSFRVEINTNIFQTEEYFQKKFALAVRIKSDEIKINPDLSTVVLFIDSTFLD